MPEYLSPGVYVEEIDAGPKPIEGVSTSTTGAVGVTAFGPTSGKPELVTSFAEFMRKFGGFLPEPKGPLFNKWALDADHGRYWYFPLSVKGFFDNGGQRLYVKRVFSSTAVAASGNLGSGMVSAIESDASAGATELQLSHLIDIGVTLNSNPPPVVLHVFNGKTFTEIGAGFNVASYDPAINMVKLAAALPEAVSAKRGDFVGIHAFPNAAVPNANATLVFKAKSRGSWGKDLSVKTSPMVGAVLNILSDASIVDASTEVVVDNPGTVTAGGKTTVTVVDLKDLAAGDQVTVAGKVYTISNLQAGPKTFEISPALPPGPGWAVGTKINRVRTDATTIKAVTPAGGPPPFTIEVDDIRDIGANDHLIIENKEYVVTNLDAPNKKFRVNDVLGAAAGKEWAQGTSVKRIHAANNTAVPGKTVNVRGASTLYPGAILELSNGKDKDTRTVISIDGEQVTLSANLTNPYFEGQKVRVIEAEVNIRYRPTPATPADLPPPEVSETFTNLRLKDDGTLNYIIKHVNTRSALVEVSEGTAGISPTDLSKFPITPNGAWLSLSGGDDKLDDLSVDDFVGADGGSGSRTGIQALEDIDEVSICIAPGIWSGTVQSALIQHCEILKDRFAIIDPQDGLSIEGIRTFREPIDSKYAAIYYPWIEVRDPSAKRSVYVAPSGHMAGIYARVDVERGVHKAPANEVIRGITKIAQDVTKREQDMLNPKGINALRFFPGRGNRVWGARTVSSDGSWKYINVRRLFIFVEESIDEGTQFVVFEPNDEPLWARVRQTVTNFLTTVWRNGALQGSTAAEAFFVKCDHTTMTQDDIDNGKLICVIGIAPVKPAEFVIFRIQQKTIESKS